MRIHGLRIRRSLPFFADVMGHPGFVRGDDVSMPPPAKPADPDITFADTYEFGLGGRRLVLLSVPGGETIDSLVVWLPDDRVALVGNMFSALFGHFPNLMTLRGDRTQERTRVHRLRAARDRPRCRGADARPSRPGTRRRARPPGVRADT